MEFIGVPWHIERRTVHLMHKAINWCFLHNILSVGFGSISAVIMCFSTGWFAYNSAAVVQPFQPRLSEFTRKDGTQRVSLLGTLQSEDISGNESQLNKHLTPSRGEELMLYLFMYLILPYSILCCVMLLNNKKFLYD